MKTCQNKRGVWSCLNIGSLLFILTLLVTNLQAKQITLFVATNGNDAWTGTLAKPTSKDGPFATLSKALNTARAFRQSSGTNSDIKILLRGGTFELSEPIILKPEDSGSSSNHPLLITVYKEEQVLISGGRQISNWKPVDSKPGLWTSQIPAVREGKWYFHQLFINGQRKQRARTPNQGFFKIEGPNPQPKPASFHYRPGDIKSEWATNGDTEVIALISWAEFRMNIHGVDDTDHIVTLSGNPQPYNQEANARYYIENTPDALDQPGEWYLDRKTGVLTYFAGPNEDPTKEEVIASNLPELLRFEGDIKNQRPVHDIHIEGINFAYSDWQLPTNGYADVQAAMDIPAAIHGEAVQNCVLKDCTIKHLGGYALDFGKASKHIRVEGNEIADIGAGGIRLGSSGISTNSFERTEQNILTDNHIHSLGRIYPAGVGILAMLTANNLIAHNHIHDLYYTAISVGWSWGYSETFCHGNIVEFNHLHDVGQDMLSDMGGIYTLGIQKGTVLRNNLIHDVSSFSYGGWGLYTDEGSSYILLESNIVYHCKSAGFHQHYGRENIIRNNIFALNRENQLMRTRAESHLSFSFTNNIVYFDSGELLGSNWGDKQFEMDHNLYLDTRHTNNFADIKFIGTTFADWQKQGRDLHSLIADPLFVAPATYDFRLKTNSPAFKLGFKQIDMSGVGVRNKRDRK